MAGRTFRTEMIIHTDFFRVLGKLVEAVDEGVHEAGEFWFAETIKEARAIEISQNGKVYVAYRTGFLANTTGRAYSKLGQGRFGALTSLLGASKTRAGLTGANKNDSQVAVATTAGYGFWVHNGTSKVPARPFILNALVANAAQMHKIIQDKANQPYVWK